MHFTIRDLFWIMFVVGFSLWSLNWRWQVRSAQHTHELELKEEIARLKADRERAAAAEDYAIRTVRNSKAVIRQLNLEFNRLEARYRAEYEIRKLGEHDMEPPFWHDRLPAVSASSR